jgi:RimJ/RimL family protein N-acetyltransferase
MLSFKKPTIADLDLYFTWANDPLVREQSFNSETINIETHTIWFEKILNDNSFSLFLFENQLKEKVGQVRIMKQDNSEAIIGITVDKKHRGKGYAKEMLIIATNDFFKDNSDYILNAFIKKENSASKFSFEKAGFKFRTTLNYENFRCFHYTSTKKDENK